MTIDNPQPHIRLTEVDKICLISGNPDRVPIIASFLIDATKIADHRGLVAYRGKTPKNEIPVTVLTTGMGCPSQAIVLEEAYRVGGRIFIRIGSTGSLQPGEDMGIGTIFIPHGAIRDEGTSPKFAPLEYPAVASPKIHYKLCQSAEKLGIPYKTGIVWSSDIYYAPNTDLYKKWAKLRAVCIEMESSTLFIFGSSKDDKIMTGTILTSDGNLEEGTNIYSGNVEENKKIFQEGVKKTIECVIEAIETIKI
ncbi:MAG: nucleoside phosphorylase [Candidatus Hodarchaeales archaeon]|jgi:uridine phosphorylase